MKKIIKVVLVLLVMVISALLIVINNKGDKYYEIVGYPNMKIAVSYNGDARSDFPVKDSNLFYNVIATCDNADARWDYDAWELVIGNLVSESKCKVSFTTRSKDTLYNYIRKHDNRFIKATINEDNVVGWSRYYYNHCTPRKAKKIKFFEELKKPSTVLGLYINPWTGVETDFRFIMDLLNDPAEQKKIGAFYTPAEYAIKSCELVLEAIKRVPSGNDYVIIDRCAGTGNLEWYLNDFSEDCGDDILSHVIVSSPELKEWEVLRERVGNKVRHLLPEVSADETPQVSENGYLIGANALDVDFLNNPIIKQYIDNENCTIILFENPPYAQGSSVTNQMEKIGKDACEWKNSYVVQEMKKEVSGTPTNEMCNAFIWSAFKYYLRQPTDSYIVFAPPKYWKYHNLVNKKMIRGFGFNRQFFHATASLISCIAWTNIDDNKTDKLLLETFNIKDENKGGGVEKLSEVYLQKMYTLHSNIFYDNRTFDDDILDDWCDFVKYMEENRGIVLGEFYELSEF